MSRRLVILVAVFAMALAALAPAGVAGAQDAALDLGGSKSVAESTTGSYVVVMEERPLVATQGKDGLRTAQAQSEARRLVDSHQEAMRAAGVAVDKKVHDYTAALNGFSAIMSYAEAQRIAGAPGVAMVLPDEMRQKTTDSSTRFMGLHANGGPWAYGLDGEGVVIGVIDSGIWPEHPSFADDGSYSAGPVLDDSIRPSCDFGNTAQNPLDLAFTCNNKLVGARQMLDTYRLLIGADPDEYDSARDDDGHGTHTASTAAGNAGVDAAVFDNAERKIAGVAHRAHVIAYKGLGNLGGFGSDLAAAIDQAVIDGVDVINYSIGGGPSLIGPDDLAFLFAADAGVFVATSAGNSGPGPETVGGPGTVPWLTTVGANTQTRFLAGKAVLGGKGNSFLGASITDGSGDTKVPLIDAEFAGGDLCLPGTLKTKKVDGKIVLCRRGGADRTAKSLAVYEAGGVGMIMYNNSDEDNLFSDSHWVPSVHVDQTEGLAIKDYIANDANPRAKIVTDLKRKWSPAPSLTIFSSRGPNAVAPDIIKPDITAPGIHILAGNSPTPDPGTTPPGELFQAIAGTSMSSPHIAGVFALIKQKYPDWSAAAARSAIMTSAYQGVYDNDRVSMADPFGMGSGHVDPSGLGIKDKLWKSDDKAGDWWDPDPSGFLRKGSALRPGLVYDAGFSEYLGFLCDAAPEAFVDAVATCGALEGDGVPTEAVNLNYPSIGISELAGTRTVTRTVTSVIRDYFGDTEACAEGGSCTPKTRLWTVSVDAPPGYDVEVTPKKFRIATGESKTYSVTITNTGAPVGEWRFGSLTWTDGRDKFDVYSPIAVKGALLDAPTEISETGVAGSTSFPVSFGYSGDYNAVGRGLVADDPITDTVVQDPDQNWDPTDGFSNEYEFDLTNATRFRAALPPESTDPDVDLDVFLLDPDGSLIALSTAGGTDELIDIRPTVPGTYTLYVHGWLVPAGSVEFTMNVWVVPKASSSLVVDSEPADAVLATTGTVEASWSGLDSDTVYLGTVNHIKDGKVIRQTAIEVDTS